MAQLRPDWNFLGLEIREPLVNSANQQRDNLGLDNLHYLFCNANVSLPSLLRSLPPGVLRYVTIQFPDPWFKKRHHKRRLVQPALVEALGDCLIPGGEVLLQSDVEAVAQEMVDRFGESPLFRARSATWLPTNPLPIPTEREQATLRKGLPVYRQVFQRQVFQRQVFQRQGTHPPVAPPPMAPRPQPQISPLPPATAPDQGSIPEDPGL